MRKSLSKIYLRHIKESHHTQIVGMNIGCLHEVAKSALTGWVIWGIVILLLVMEW